MKPFRRTIIGKHALVLVARGELELASQIFVYDQLREIRLNLEDFEVKVLMSYDESYYRVFIVKPKDDTEEEKKKANDQVIKFYNDLLNATMKLTTEELENIRKQQQQLMKKQVESTKTPPKVNKPKAKN